MSNYGFDKLGYLGWAVRAHLLVSSDTGTLCKWYELWGVYGLPLVPELLSSELWASFDVLYDLNESRVRSHVGYVRMVQVFLEALDALAGISLPKEDLCSPTKIESIARSKDGALLQVAKKEGYKCVGCGR